MGAKHLIHVIDVVYLSDYRLRVTFDDGAVKIVDLKPELNGEIYEPLKDMVFFKQVSINPDFNPDFPLEKNFVQVSQHGGPEALAHRPQNQARFFLGTDNSKWFLPELFFHAPPTASTIPCSVESVC